MSQEDRSTGCVVVRETEALSPSRTARAPFERLRPYPRDLRLFTARRMSRDENGVQHDTQAEDRHEPPYEQDDAVPGASHIGEQNRHENACR